MRRAPTTEHAAPTPVNAKRRGADRIRRPVVHLAMALLVVLSFGSGTVVDRIVREDGNVGASTSLTDRPEFEVMHDVWDLIHEQYVDIENVDDTALLYGAIDGMVEAVGDTGHTAFLDPDEATSFIQSREGEFIGIGVYLDFPGANPVIVAPLENSPADEAGIEPGDVILEIEGKSTVSMSQFEVSGLLKGEEGSSVSLILRRAAGDEEYEVTLVRSKIVTEPVAWALLPGGIAHIRIRQFTVGATEDLREAIRDAVAAGATSMVLDLRNNPGGLVFEAIGVASQFMPEGKIIYRYQERDGSPRPVRTVGEGIATDLPMVVLINRGSASAAEILAASLRDNRRATLIGETTVGTGTVLSPLTLDDDSILLLGTALWLTPIGEQVWKVGVEPDVEVRDSVPSSIFRPDDGALVDQAELRAAEDVQLDEAISVVTADGTATDSAGIDQVDGVEVGDNQVETESTITEMMVIV